MEENDRVNQVKINTSEIKIIDLHLVEVCKSICKITCKKKFGTGFFIKLHIDDKKLFCLMTNHHVVTKEMIDSNDVIDVRYNLEKDLEKIKLDTKKRVIIYDFHIDITIIEIIPEDKIKNKFFLSPNLNDVNYINQNIYIPQYPEGKNLSYSEGKIQSDKNNELIYDASTERGSSGSPIFLKETTEVIGVHKQGSSKILKNKGISIFSIIKTLESRNKDNKLANKLVNNNFTEFYENGDYYIGQSLNGKKHGKGKIFFSDGNIKYEGDFVNGKKKEMVNYFLMIENIILGNFLIIKYMEKESYILLMVILNMKVLLLMVKKKEMVNIFMKMVNIILANF